MIDSSLHQATAKNAVILLQAVATALCLTNGIVAIVANLAHCCLIDEANSLHGGKLQSAFGPFCSPTDGIAFDEASSSVSHSRQCTSLQCVSL